MIIISLIGQIPDISQLLDTGFDIRPDTGYLAWSDTEFYILLETERKREEDRKEQKGREDKVMSHIYF